jgi:peptidyl-prolyl cis-trans isomerase SurA
MMPRLRHLLCPLAFLAGAAAAAADDAPISANLTSAPAPATSAAAPTGASAPATPSPAAPTAMDAPVGELKQDKFTDSVAAVVNGKIITLDELNKEMKPDVDNLFQAIDAKYGDDPVMAKQIFDQQVNARGIEALKAMVDRLLIIQEFTDKGYKVPAYYIERQFEDDMASQFHDSREEFIKYLAARGETELDYRKRIEEDDEVGYLADQMHSSTTGLSPDRIKDYYEKHKEDYFVKASIKVRQIVLKPVADSPVAEQAVKIVEEARQPGANFLTLAQKYSSDPLARDGILPDQTFTNENKLPPEVQQAVFNLQPGQVSDPVTTHDPQTNDTVIFIFVCDEKIAEGYRKIEDVYPDIEKTLAAQDDKQSIEKWLQHLRDKAYIKYGLSSGN